MKHQLSFAVLAALGAFALFVLAGVPLTYQAQAQASPSVAVSLSSASVEEGHEITVTMSFSGLESDADTATKDYVFRADVVDSENGDADACEDRAGGYGLGVERYLNLVDENPETRTGSISADCPAGQYTVRASISDANSAELASDSADFSVVEPPSTDAALSGLALSGVDIGTFDPATYSYDVNVGHEVAETTVTATTNDGGATYVIRVDGVEDGDGTVPLAEGNNLIAVEVTAEDGETTRTYTATVTRAEGSSSDNPVPPSDDATLKSLELSGIAFAFDPATYSYDLSVGYEVERTAITAATNHAGASYEVVMVISGGYEDGMVTLAEGANTIVLVVEAEDGETFRTYAVIVTRAAAPAPEPTPEPTATPEPEKERVSGEEQASVFVRVSLFPSSVEPGTAIEVNMAFMGLEQDSDRSTTDYVFRADVKDSEGADADACEDRAGGYGMGVNRYMHQVDENPEERTAQVSTDCPAGVYRVEAYVADAAHTELARASADFTVREQPQPPVVTVLLEPSGTVLPGTTITANMEFSNLIFDSDRSTVDYIFRADVVNAEGADADACEDRAGRYGMGVDHYMHQVDENPEERTAQVSADCPAGVYRVEAYVADADHIELARATADFTVRGLPGTPTGLSVEVQRESLLLTWASPPDEDIVGYQILRGRSDSAGGELSIVVEDTGNTDTSWMDTDVEVDKSYVYQVKARDGFGAGHGSDQVSVTIDGWPPPAPVIAMLIPGTKGETGDITIGWHQATGWKVTGYRIWRQSDVETEPVEIMSNTPSAAMWFDSDVELNRTYTYWVAGINEYGVSERSDPKTVTTPEAWRSPPPELGADYSHTYIPAANKKYSFEENGPHSPNFFGLLIANFPLPQGRTSKITEVIVGFTPDDDASTLDYVVSMTIRKVSDGTIVHDCHGEGLTTYSERVFSKQDLEVYKGGYNYRKTGLVSQHCPGGDYHLKIEILDHELEYVWGMNSRLIVR